MSVIRTTAYVLLTGYILSFFSEWMFWSGRPTDPDFIIGLVPTWLTYSFITFLFLAAVDYFRVRTLWAAFLAGALYGWLLEGIIVQTTYADFPLNLSWTALAWHASISVVFGGYVLPRALRNGRRIALWCVVFGLCLGVWSTGWWSETTPAAIESVVLYNCGFGIGLVAAYVWRDKLTFKVNRSAIYSGIALLGLYYVAVTLPTQPLSLVLLPPLLIVTLLTLRRNRRQEAEHPLEVIRPITIRRAATLLFIPLTASAVYAAAFMMGMTLPGLQIAYLMLTPIGFIAFAVSVYQVWRGRNIPILLETSS